MNNVRRGSIVVVALTLTVVLALLQLAWNLHSPDYMRDVARRSNTPSAIASALPEYAATKLPNPEEAKQVFTREVTAKTVAATAEPLYQSVSNAYNGRTDVVSFSLDPLVAPVVAAGYQIPPGTELANRTIQINGLAGTLRGASRALGVAFMVLILAGGLMFLLNIKRGPLRPIRSVAMLTALLLGGLYLSMLAVPTLLESLISSSGLDANLRSILITYIGTVANDSKTYYLGWLVLLVIVAIIVSVLRGLTSRGHKQNRDKKPKDKKAKPLLDEPAFKEL